MTTDTVNLSATDLKVELTSGAEVVEEFELELGAGEIVGLVGESGSGKSSTALALLGYHKRGVEITSADIRIGDVKVEIGARAREIRGRLISYVPQDPGPALNPSLRIGAAIEDVVRAHRPEHLRPGVAAETLALVGLPATTDFSQRFPHQLSGGQQQRVCIALALACEPSVVVLDEPTTGLDVLTQAHILRELSGLREQRGLSMLYVTHDLAVVAEIADRIMVMYAGRVVEQGPTGEVLSQPNHPYTRGLLAATPDHLHPRPLRTIRGVAPSVGERPPGCAFAPRCPQRVERCEQEMPPLEPVAADRLVRCFEWQATPPVDDVRVAPVAETTAPGAVPALEVKGLYAEYRSRRECVTVATDVTFTIEQGSCVALVGESGSGKTTIARVVAGLHQRSTGEIDLFGEALPTETARRTRAQKQRLQLIFQNPLDALNPRHSVQYSVGRPARLYGLARAELDQEVTRLLELVRLPARVANRYPAELSGGERQRVAIARALATKPDLLICDEITSALDVSVQASVIEILKDLRRELKLSLLFITHDLGIVAAIADQTLVLNRGVVCEEAPTMDLLRAPQHEYTQRLLAAAPSIAAVEVPGARQ